MFNSYAIKMEDIKDPSFSTEIVISTFFVLGFAEQYPPDKISISTADCLISFINSMKGTYNLVSIKQIQFNIKQNEA